MPENLKVISYDIQENILDRITTPNKRDRIKAGLKINVEHLKAFFTATGDRAKKIIDDLGDYTENNLEPAAKKTEQNTRQEAKRAFKDLKIFGKDKLGF